MATKKSSSPKRKRNIPAFLKPRVSAQSKEYIKGYRVKPIQESEVFRKSGIEKRGTKYVNKSTGRSFKDKDAARNYAAKQAGFKSYKDYLALRKTQTYKQFEKRAREKGKPVDLASPFAKAFREWQKQKPGKKKYQKKSEEMRNLLTIVEWIDQYNYGRYV